MAIRVLFASSPQLSPELQQMLRSSSQSLVCFPVTFAAVASLDELWLRVESSDDDVVLLDWRLAEAATPDLVRRLLVRNAQLHIIVLLPQSLRQYRQSVWEAGACSSIPLENIDQEWLSSILCVMQRAMEHRNPV
jgi:DNA-binding NarL/FixJ family response regulator